MKRLLDQVSSIPLPKYTKTLVIAGSKAPSFTPRQNIKSD